MKNNFIKHQKQNDIVECVKRVVMEYYELEKSVFSKGSRNKQSSLIKQQTIFLISQISDSEISHEYLAKLFEYKNHCSVNNAISSINDRIGWDKQLHVDLLELSKIIFLEEFGLPNDHEDEAHFYVNMNNFTSVTSNPNRSIIYIGYSDKEIYELSPQDEPVEIRKHKKTYKFILETK